MKSMKRAITTTTALVLILSLAGCAAGISQLANALPGTQTEATKAPAAAPSPTDTPADTASWTLSQDLGDANCTHPVDPFKLEDNLKQVLSGMATGFLTEVVKGRSLNLESAKATALAQGRQAAKQANWLPLSVEEIIGQDQHERLQASKAPEDQGYKMLGREDEDDVQIWSEAEKILDSIVKTLPENQPYKFKIIVTNREKSGSAFALPGGYIYIPKGNIPTVHDNKKARTAKTNSVTFVIAHEIAHILKRHETRQTQASLINAVDGITALANLVGLLSQSNKDAQVSAANKAEIKKQVTILKAAAVRYDVPQERQADGCSLRIMLAGKQDAQAGFSSFLELLLSEAADQKAQTPASDQNKEDLSDAGSAKPATPPAAKEAKAKSNASDFINGIFGGGKNEAPQSGADTASTGSDRSHPDFPDRKQNGTAVLNFWKLHPPAPLADYVVETTEKR